MMFMLFVGMGWAAGVTDLKTISNGKVYVLTSNRGPLLYDANQPNKIWAAIIGTKGDGATPGRDKLNVEDPNQQFALLRADNTTDGDYYLYSVGAKKFVKRDGNQMVLTETPEGTFRFNPTNNKDFPWFICVGSLTDPHRLNINANAMSFLTKAYAGDDDGNRFTFLEGKEVDFTQQITAINKKETEGLPFKVSTLTNGEFGTGMHWYNLEIQRATKEYPSYNRALNINTNSTNKAQLTKAGLYAFVGNKFNGFKIYNYVAGAGKVLWSSDVVNNAIVPMTNVSEVVAGTDWDVIANGSTGWVFKRKVGSNGYLNDVNDKIGYWTDGASATDVGSTFKFIEVSSEQISAIKKVDVLVEHKYQNEVFNSELVIRDVTNGAEWGNLNELADSYYGLKSAVTTSTTNIQDGAVVTVDYVKDEAVTMPFETSTLTDGHFGTDMKWYTVKVRFTEGANKEKVVAYDFESNLNKTSDNIPSSFGAEHFYAFVGDPAHGYKIYNCKAGDNKVLWESKVSDGGNIPMTEVANVTAGTDWMMVKKSKADREGFVFIKKGTNNGYLHDMRGTLSFWIDTNNAPNDYGSFFNFQPVEDLSALIEAEKESAKTRLREYCLSTMPSIAEDFTSVNNKIDEISNQLTLIELYDKLQNIKDQVWMVADGKTVTMKNNGDNGRSDYFLTMNDASSGVCGQTSIKERMLWTMKYDAQSNKFRMYNPVAKKYWAKEPGHVTDKENEAGLYQFEFSSTVTGLNKCAFVRFDGNTKKMVHQLKGGNVGNWVDINDAASVWTVVTEKDFINEELNKYKAFPNCVGGYSQENLNNIQKQPTISEFLKYNIISFDANQLYRIKNVKRNLSLHTGSNVLEGEETAYMSSTKYSGDGAISCHTTSLADAGCVWSFEVVPNSNPMKYQLKNLNSNSCIAKTAAAGSQGLAMTTSDAGEYTLTYHGMGQFSLVCSNGLGGHKELHVSGSGVMNYNGGANSPSAWYLIPATELEVNLATVGEKAYTSLYVPFAVSMPANVEAYTATQVSGQNVLTMHKQSEVPANEGMVLKADKEVTKATLNVLSTTNKTLDSNVIEGTNKAEAITDKNTIWVLGNNSGKIGFYHPSASLTTLAANKAYVKLPAASAVNGFVLDFGDLTGVESVEVETPAAQQVIYDMAGRRVAKMTKGLYIVNGKKVLVK